MIALPLRLFGVFAALWTSTLVLAQSTPAFPSCAVPCITSAFQEGLCAPSNQTCICTDPVFQRTVTLCVTASCTIPDSLLTRNASLTNCGAPVRSRGGEYVLLSNIMAAFAAACVITRFAYKIFLAGLDLGIDDWFILASLIAIVPSAIITVYGTTPNGLGRDVWTLNPDQITNVSFYFYIMAWLYFLQVTLVKLSFITFYTRIFPAKDVQRLLWGTFIFTALWGFSFVITAVFQCWPIPYFWRKWDGMHEGRCASANSISWSNASMNIALDLWILAIPLWQLRNLQLHWKKKLGVAMMFCVGTFVTVVSILRLQSLVHFAATNNSTWESYSVSVWSTIEITVGIMCACLPAIRMVLVKAFPILGGTTLRSRGNKYYQQYASGHGSRSGTSGLHGTVGAATADRSFASQEHDSDDRGIRLQKTYQVQYAESDEARLVQMHDLDMRGKGAPRMPR
ncbi:CFEM domain-containing protein [Plectosphaerella plurivora]|uniref:CFEM domain-containing protein n=1 Tax=Plectosphaerella plurivora TaxID=936078 RepID=A0A9P8VFE9_9PEZI|nr:CFEM domain-containing protein [Plectosphaerella plurivora]